jgi:putative ABC transport system substrate-binding protein
MRGTLPGSTAAGFLALCAACVLPAAAADSSAMPRIGALVRPQSNAPYEAGFREGLRELGYVEGKSIAVDWRRSRGGEEDVTVAGNLARSKLDAIVVFSTPGAQAAMKANPNVPLVFLSGDPVATGLVASLARPGGNATGLTGVMTELTSKRMELLQQLAPGVRRTICLANPVNPASTLQCDAAKTAAHALGVQFQELEARNVGQLEAALAGLPRGTRNALYVTADGLFLVNKAKIARAVREARLPASFPFRDYHEHGVLMSYGLNPHEVGRKMADYVDRILKGAKPGDLPVEQISKYELIIDLRVARDLGLEVPQNLVLQADRVIR